MSKKILVIDNSPVILKLLSHILKHEGHKVVTAENGLDALEKLQHFHPDIIFVDLIMPKISGDIFCRIIRSRKEFHQVILVVLSAIAAEENYDFKSLGADAYIAKGPAAEMTKHINYVIKNCKADKYKLSNTEVLGLDGVSKREITSELLSTKHHYEITLEHMTDGFIEMTADARIIYANSSAAAFFNLTREQLISSHFYSYFRSKTQLVITECLEKLDDDAFELGEEESISINKARVMLKFIPLKEQEQQSVIVLITDITSRKKMEQQIVEDLMYLEENIALRTKEYLKSNELLHEEISKHGMINDELTWLVKQLRKTLDIIPDLVSIHDENMKFVMVNKAFANAFETTPDKMIGHHYYTLIHNSASPPPNCPHQQAVQKKKTISQEIDDLIPGRSLLISCTPCYNEDGSLLATVLIAKDIAN